MSPDGRPEIIYPRGWWYPGVGRLFWWLKSWGQI